MSRIISSLFWKFIDVVFPPHCAGCGTMGTRWCSVCQEATTPVPAQHCFCCGKLGVRSNLCRYCKQEKPVYQQSRAWGMHDGPLRKAVHKIKYQRDLGLGEVMAKNLAEVVQQCGWEVDVVMPVPLSLKRKKERGYNQAGLLAQPLAWDLGMEYQRRGLRRVRETVSQIDLSRQERRTNVAGAFLADEKYVGGKRVLLVDDVMTTGATVNAAAQALVDAGADEVFVVTMARAG